MCGSWTASSDSSGGGGRCGRHGAGRWKEVLAGRPERSNPSPVSPVDFEAKPKELTGRSRSVSKDFTDQTKLIYKRPVKFMDRPVKFME